MNIHACLIVIAVVALVATPATAQIRTSFAVAPGLSTGTSDTGAAVAGSVSVDVESRLTLDGVVGMAGRGPGAGAGYAVGRPDARALVVFGNGGSATVAVVTVGFGYRR